MITYSDSNMNTSNTFVITGDASNWTGGGTGISMSAKKKGLNPRLVFKLWKKKLTPIGQKKYKDRLAKLKKLSEKYAKLGHIALSEKFLQKVKDEVILAELEGAGIRHWLSEKLVNKYKYNILGGHISDTPFEEFTRVIPEKVLARKKELDKIGVFTGYVIYHYWNSEIADRIEKDQEMTSDEKDAMKDPILFGIREDSPGRLYFIADWEDEYCDLTFNELVDALDDEAEEIVEMETRLPKLVETRFKDWFTSKFRKEE